MIDDKAFKADPAVEPKKVYFITPEDRAALAEHVAGALCIQDGVIIGQFEGASKDGIPRCPYCEPELIRAGDPVCLCKEHETRYLPN